MTAAQQRAEAARQERAARAAAKAAERERKRQEAEARREARARQRSIDNALRTAGRIATSRNAGSLIRGVFGTLFGRK
jgi:hypothetical protein